VKILENSILNSLRFGARKTRMKRKKLSRAMFEGYSSSFLAQLCQPATVIDVGVGHGTHPLYEAFPKAKFILVEPLWDYDAAIQDISAKYDCDVVHKAVSDAPGILEINVDTRRPHKSSLADRIPIATKAGDPLEKRVVEVTTLDRIFADAPTLRQPILLKIDTEGHELKALQGARALLRATEIVIAEVSISRRFEQDYEFEDVILFMKENGFYLLTFLNIKHQKGELRPRFADVVFKRRQ
jgi:FkbM family methyltransferase